MLAPDPLYDLVSVTASPHTGRFSRWGWRARRPGQPAPSSAGMGVGAGGPGTPIQWSS